MFGGLAPGTLVRHPEHPEWGTGQVQSVVGPRISVTFPHAGKVVINAENVELIVLPDHPDS